MIEKYIQPGVDLEAVAQVYDKSGRKQRLVFTGRIRALNEEDVVVDLSANERTCTYTFPYSDLKDGKCGLFRIKPLVSEK